MKSPARNGVFLGPKTDAKVFTRVILPRLYIGFMCGDRCAARNRRCPKLSLNSHNQSTSNNGRFISIPYAVFLPVHSARLLPSSAAGSSDSHFGKCLKCCVAANVLADHLCRLHSAHITDFSRGKIFCVYPLDATHISIVS
jgi:hypothetical protein